NQGVDPIPAIGGLIQGRTALHIPYLGAFMMWAKTLVGLAILIWLPAILLMAEEVKRLADYLGRFKLYRLRPLPRKEPNMQVRRMGIAGAGGLAVLLLGLSMAPAA